MEIPQLSCLLEGKGSGRRGGGAGYHRKEAKHELRRQAQTLPQISLGQGCRMQEV